MAPKPGTGCLEAQPVGELARGRACRRISWAARLAVPMPLTTVVPNTIAPMVLRLRSDSASPDCAAVSLGHDFPVACAAANQSDSPFPHSSTAKSVRKVSHILSTPRMRRPHNLQNIYAQLRQQHLLPQCAPGALCFVPTTFNAATANTFV